MTTDKLTTWKQYLYIDGELVKTYTTKPGVRIEKLRKWIDNAEKHWAGHGTVTRHSLDELEVVAKSGAHLRFVNR